ncbi:nickel pincer cofactor biosynthesis protein LarB [[Eubacterium] cellulosolvens]
MRDILERLVKGSISIDDAERLLRTQTIDEISNIAKLDINRELRGGIPEIILAEGKNNEDLLNITKIMLKEKGRTIISRANKEQLEFIRKTSPKNSIINIHQKAGMCILKMRNFHIYNTGGKIGILAAGTADVPIAEESKIISEELGCQTITAYDVGIAGIHRLFPSLKSMIDKDVDVIIVIAGREGALPSVVSGLVDIPVIGVPTSVGYGFGEKGIASLMAMLQGCSLGLSVVNINGGVAAGVIAVLIANRAAKFRNKNSQMK